jgi:hypothetical protein
LFDRQRRPAHRAGRCQRRQRDGRQVGRRAQNVQGGLPQSAHIEAGSTEHVNGFGLGLVDQRQKEVLGTLDLSTLGRQLPSGLLRLHRQVAGSSPRDAWRIGQSRQ